MFIISESCACALRPAPEVDGGCIIIRSFIVIIIIVIISSSSSSSIVLLFRHIVLHSVLCLHFCHFMHLSLLAVHPVSVTRFPSFRTQPLENLSHYLWTHGFLSNPAPGENLLSGNLVMETGCSCLSMSLCVQLLCWHVCLQTQTCVYLLVCSSTSNSNGNSNSNSHGNSCLYIF